MVDQIAKSFVLKVYETKALAEEGKDNNALYVFNNGIDSEDTSDELVSNGSQFINGTSDSSGAGSSLLKDSDARFGSRLKGKTVQDSLGNQATITSVDSSTQLTLSSNIIGGSETYHIVNPGSFFTFQKYFYRFESSDPVKGFIVDWDDGEDNSLEKANRQTIMLSDSGYYAVTSHTYTHHGEHFPMIKTINPEGFHSKWYVAFDAFAAGLNSIETQTLGAGQNDFSRVSLDNQTVPRIPSLGPANMPPVGVLKIDRNKVYSNIDNDIFSNITNAVAYAFVERESGTELAVDDLLEVVWEDDSNQIHVSSIAGTSDVTDLAAKHTIGTVDSIYVKRILSLKIKILTEANAAGTLAADERIKIYALANPATSVTANSNATSDAIVAMVSLGNPYLALDRPGFSITADGSQSQTRCSNVSLNKYIFDEGKLMGATAAGAAGLAYAPGMFEQVSDIMGAALGDTNSFSQSDSFRNIHYTLSPNASALGHGSGHIIDSTTKRIFDEERLIKLQVIDSSATTRVESARYFNSGSDSGSNAGEDIDGSEVLITVDDGTNFNVGNVMSRSATVDVTTHEQMYISNVDGNTLTVVRQYNGSVADSDISNGDSLFILSDNGQLGDSCTHSFIEHWEPSGYTDACIRPSSLHSRALLMYATTIGDAGGALKWRTVGDGYRNNTRVTTEGTSNDGEAGLIFGGAVDTDSGQNNGTELASETTGNTPNSPQNYLLMCKDSKFNRVHLRMNNSFTSQQESNGIDAFENTTAASLDLSRNKISLVLWYTARTSPTATTYVWKPLAFEDGTSIRTFIAGDLEMNSLLKSGSLSFNMPEDWVKLESSDLAWDSENFPLDDEDGASGTDDPENKWTKDMYGLLLGISVGIESSPAKYKCVSVQTYNNTHSQAITIIDPHHKSINDIGVSQSLMYNRKGSYVNVSDRMGRSEMRKIGAAGGTIQFGGVELSGNYATQKKLLNIYQREGTPIYYDIQRAVSSGEYIRMYGVITALSEDYPVGMQHPKFGITMQVTHVCEYDSNGAWIGKGLRSLGGELIDATAFTS
tara:strand:- start:1473 stop:4613 length:3141 start_codon:yes stop_codon:yes gene_type:complete